MTLHVLHLFFVLAAVSVRCEPNFRWMLREGDPADGFIFEIQNDETKETQNLRILQNPCSCESLMCRCCAGFNMDQISFKREGCMLFGFDPMEFSLDMKIMMNDNIVWNNSLSGKNPPEMCLPVPIPGFPAPRLDMCMKLYDIYFPGRNIHLCMDLDARMQGSSLMVLHFDCMRMGADGWAMMKPGDKVELVEEVEDEDAVYDIVSEPEDSPQDGGPAAATATVEAPQDEVVLIAEPIPAAEGENQK